MTNFNKAEEAAFEADKARQGRMEARERGQEDHLVQEGEFDGTSMARNTFKVSCKCEFHVLCTYTKDIPVQPGMVTGSIISALKLPSKTL